MTNWYYTKGTYFVTLCIAQRRELFGSILDDADNALMQLNDTGRIVDECWRTIPDHFPHVRLDQMQIMPDHLHSIIVLALPTPLSSTQWVDPTRAPDGMQARPNSPLRGSLGAIIGAFKSVTTKRMNVALGRSRGTIWQQGYYERVIRRQGGEYERIAQYIAENPANWR